MEPGAHDYESLRCKPNEAPAETEPPTQQVAGEPPPMNHATANNVAIPSRQISSRNITTTFSMTPGQTDPTVFSTRGDPHAPETLFSDEADAYDGRPMTGSGPTEMKIVSSIPAATRETITTTSLSSSTRSNITTAPTSIVDQGRPINLGNTIPRPNINRLQEHRTPKTNHPPQDASPRAQVDPTGRFERTNELLGRGAYKDVYRAFDTEEGVEVAWNQLKVDHLTNRIRAKVLSEIQILQSLRNPHIINCFYAWGASETDPSRVSPSTGKDVGGKERIYFMTELMTSGTLKSYIRRTNGPIKPKVYKNWCHQILTGLVYLHTLNPPIIHRDLKCDNIFINGNNGQAKIGDLGMATFKDREHITSVLGTPEFMAPELYDEKYDEKVDIYAFGLCLLEIITKEYPYSECTNPAQIFRKVTQGIKPRALADVEDTEAQALINVCIEGEPSLRPSSEELICNSFFEGVIAHATANAAKPIPVPSAAANMVDASGKPPIATAARSSMSPTSSIPNLPRHPSAAPAKHSDSAQPSPRMGRIRSISTPTKPPPDLLLQQQVYVEEENTHKPEHRLSKGQAGSDQVIDGNLMNVSSSYPSIASDTSQVTIAQMGDPLSTSQRSMLISKSQGIISKHPTSVTESQDVDPRFRRQHSRSISTSSIATMLHSRNGLMGPPELPSSTASPAPQQYVGNSNTHSTQRQHVVFYNVSQGSGTQPIIEQPHAQVHASRPPVQRMNPTSNPYPSPTPYQQQTVPASAYNTASHTIAASQADYYYHDRMQAEQGMFSTPPPPRVHGHVHPPGPSTVGDSSQGVLGGTTPLMNWAASWGDPVAGVPVKAGQPASANMTHQRSRSGSDVSKISDQAICVKPHDATVVVDHGYSQMVEGPNTMAITLMKLDDHGEKMPIIGQAASDSTKNNRSICNVEVLLDNGTYNNNSVTMKMVYQQVPSNTAEDASMSPPTQKQEIKFPFDLDVDTALDVVTEMVGENVLPAEDSHLAITRINQASELVVDFLQGDIVDPSAEALNSDLPDHLAYQMYNNTSVANEAGVADRSMTPQPRSRRTASQGRVRSVSQPASAKGRKRRSRRFSQSPSSSPVTARILHQKAYSISMPTSPNSTIHRGNTSATPSTVVAAGRITTSPHRPPAFFTESPLTQNIRASSPNLNGPSRRSDLPIDGSYIPAIELSKVTSSPSLRHQSHLLRSQSSGISQASSNVSVPRHLDSRLPHLADSPSVRPSHVHVKRAHRSSLSDLGQLSMTKEPVAMDNLVPNPVEHSGRLARSSSVENGRSRKNSKVKMKKERRVSKRVDDDNRSSSGSDWGPSDNSEMNSTTGSDVEPKSSYSQGYSSLASSNDASAYSDSFSSNDDDDDDHAHGRPHRDKMKHKRRDKIRHSQLVQHSRHFANGASSPKASRGGQPGMRPPVAPGMKRQNTAALSNQRGRSKVLSPVTSRKKADVPGNRRQQKPHQKAPSVRKGASLLSRQNSSSGLGIAIDGDRKKHEDAKANRRERQRVKLGGLSSGASSSDIRLKKSPKIRAARYSVNPDEISESAKPEQSIEGSEKNLSRRNQGRLSRQLSSTENVFKTKDAVFVKSQDSIDHFGGTQVVNDAAEDSDDDPEIKELQDRQRQEAMALNLMHERQWTELLDKVKSKKVVQPSSNSTNSPLLLTKDGNIIKSRSQLSLNDSDSPLANIQEEQAYKASETEGTEKEIFLSPAVKLAEQIAMDMSSNGGMSMKDDACQPQPVIAKAEVDPGPTTVAIQPNPEKDINLTNLLSQALSEFDADKGHGKSPVIERPATTGPSFRPRMGDPGTMTLDQMSKRHPMAPHPLVVTEAVKDTAAEKIDLPSMSVETKSAPAETPAFTTSVQSTQGNGTIAGKPPLGKNGKYGIAPDDDERGLVQRRTQSSSPMTDALPDPLHERTAKQE